MIEDQEEMNKALETSGATEAAMQQRVQEAKQQLQQAKEEHHRQILAKEAELKKVKEHNEKQSRIKNKSHSNTYRRHTRRT